MSNKGPLYDKGTEYERLFHINYIPYRYWKTEPKDVSFSAISYTPQAESKIRVPVDAQENYYASVLEEIRTHKNVKKFAGTFLCISSAPSEEHAMQAGFVLATSLIRTDVAANIGAIDLSLFNPVDKASAPDLVVIHNITCDSTRDRLQHARDYINWATRRAFCVLCTSGKNPLEMCYEVLRMPANMVLYSDERSAKRVLSF